MPIGLKNTSVTFRRVMNTTLRNCIEKCYNYKDDEIIFSDIVEQPLAHNVLEIFKELDKSNFFQNEIEFLGHYSRKN